MRVLRLTSPQDLRAALRVLRRGALEGNITVLVGAGISRAGPSTLPLSRHVVEAIGQAIASRLGVSPGILLDHSGEPMRLEPFLRVIAQLCGFSEVENILSVLRSDKFNCNHASLAALIAHHAGCPVVCLNFDYLIEEAARSLYTLELEPSLPGERPARAERHGSVPFPRLLKAHGTLLKGGGSSGIVATIQQIETYAYDPIWSAMRSMVAGRALLVTGYSDDDIDVFPCLNASQPSTVLWNTLSEELPRRVGEWLTGIDAATPVFHLIGPCEKVFGRFPVVRSRPRSAGLAPAVEQHMEAWARGTSVGLLASIGAWIAQDRHRVDNSEELYQQALASGDLDRDVRRYVRFRYAELLRHQADNKPAALPQYISVLSSAVLRPIDPHLGLAALRSIAGIARSISHRVDFPGNLLLAIAAASILGVVRGARRVLAEVDSEGRLARREWSGSWLEWEMGMVLLGASHAHRWPWQLRTHLLYQSYRFFRRASRSADIYERASGLFGQARALMALGTVRGDLKWKEWAARKLTRAEQVFAILDDLTGLKNAERLRSSLNAGRADPWLAESA